MMKVIDILGFKVNNFNKWLRKNDKGQIDTQVKSPLEAHALDLLKEPGSSDRPRPHLRLVK
ncbi:MAG: hypothetical protein ABI270_05565 [Nitrosospira sp.]